MRLRFSTATLFLVTALVALGVGWWRERQQHSQTHRMLLQEQSRNDELSARIREFQQLVPDPARKRLRHEGRLEEALVAFEGALQAQTRVTDEREVYDTIFYVGELYSLTGQPDNAAEHLVEYIEYARKHPRLKSRLATALNHLGGVRRLQGRYDEAIQLQHESLDIKKQTQPNHWTIYNLKRSLGECFLALRRFEDAEQVLVEAHRGLVATEVRIWEPQRSTRVPRAAQALVALYEEWGRPEQAEEWRRELKRIKEKSEGNH